MAEYLTTDIELTLVADAIRAKGGTSAALAYPTEFVAAISAIPTGGAAYDTMNAEEIYAAAASGWGSTTPSLEAAIWSSVAAGWSVSSTVTDGQIEAAVSAGWR